MFPGQFAQGLHCIEREPTATAERVRSKDVKKTGETVETWAEHGCGDMDLRGIERVLLL